MTFFVKNKVLFKIIATSSPSSPQEAQTHGVLPKKIEAITNILGTPNQQGQLSTEESLPIYTNFWNAELIALIGVAVNSEHAEKLVELEDVLSRLNSLSLFENKEKSGPHLISPMIFVYGYNLIHSKKEELEKNLEGDDFGSDAAYHILLKIEAYLKPIDKQFEGLKTNLRSNACNNTQGVFLNYTENEGRKTATFVEFHDGSIACNWCQDTNGDYSAMDCLLKKDATVLKYFVEDYGKDTVTTRLKILPNGGELKDWKLNRDYTQSASEYKLLNGNVYVNWESRSDNSQVATLYKTLNGTEYRKVHVDPEGRHTANIVIDADNTMYTIWRSELDCTEAADSAVIQEEFLEDWKRNQETGVEIARQVTNKPSDAPNVYNWIRFKSIEPEKRPSFLAFEGTQYLAQTFGEPAYEDVFKSNEPKKMYTDYWIQAIRQAFNDLKMSPVYEKKRAELLDVLYKTISPDFPQETHLIEHPDIALLYKEAYTREHAALPTEKIEVIVEILGSPSQFDLLNSEIPLALYSNFWNIELLSLIAEVCNGDDIAKLVMLKETLIKLSNSNIFQENALDHPDLISPSIFYLGHKLFQSKKEALTQKLGIVGSLGKYTLPEIEHHLKLVSETYATRINNSLTINPKDMPSGMYLNLIFLNDQYCRADVVEFDDGKMAYNCRFDLKEETFTADCFIDGQGWVSQNWFEDIADKSKKASVQLRSQGEVLRDWIQTADNTQTATIYKSKDGVREAWEQTPYGIEKASLYKNARGAELRGWSKRVDGFQYASVVKFAGGEFKKWTQDTKGTWSAEYHTRQNQIWKNWRQDRDENISADYYKDESGAEYENWFQDWEGHQSADRVTQSRKILIKWNETPEGTQQADSAIIDKATLKNWALDPDTGIETARQFIGKDAKTGKKRFADWWRDNNKSTIGKNVPPALVNSLAAFLPNSEIQCAFMGLGFRPADMLKIARQVVYKRHPFLASPQSTLLKSHFGEPDAEDVFLGKNPLKIYRKHWTNAIQAELSRINKIREALNILGVKSINDDKNKKEHAERLSLDLTRKRIGLIDVLTRTVSPFYPTDADLRENIDVANIYRDVFLRKNPELPVNVIGEIAKVLSGPNVTELLNSDNPMALYTKFWNVELMSLIGDACYSSYFAKLFELEKKLSVLTCLPIFQSEDSNRPHLISPLIFYFGYTFFKSKKAALEQRIQTHGSESDSHQKLLQKIEAHLKPIAEKYAGSIKAMETVNPENLEKGTYINYSVINGNQCRADVVVLEDGEIAYNWFGDTQKQEVSTDCLFHVNNYVAKYWRENREENYSSAKWRSGNNDQEFTQWAHQSDGTLTAEEFKLSNGDIYLNWTRFPDDSIAAGSYQRVNGEVYNEWRQYSDGSYSAEQFKNGDHIYVEWKQDAQGNRSATTYKNMTSFYENWCQDVQGNVTASYCKNAANDEFYEWSQAADLSLTTAQIIVNPDGSIGLSWSQFADGRQTAEKLTTLDGVEFVNWCRYPDQRESADWVYALEETFKNWRMDANGNQTFENS